MPLNKEIKSEIKEHYIIIIRVISSHMYPTNMETFWINKVHLFWDSFEWFCLQISHHHVVPPARISLTLSGHFSQSFIAFGRSSGLHPLSSHSFCMYVRAGRPAFAWPYAGVHRSTSLMNSSLLLQQSSACLVRLNCIVSWWEASRRIVGILWGIIAWLVQYCSQHSCVIAV